MVSSLLMLVFRASESALWMGTSTFGLFMSNVFPTSVALAEQYFNVTGLSDSFSNRAPGLHAKNTIQCRSASF